MNRSDRSKNRPSPGPNFLRAELVADSANEENRTVEIIFSTGAAVRRWRFTEDFRVEEFDQSLEISPEAIRTDFLNSGRAPFLDTHNAGSLDAVLGVIEAGSVEIDPEAREARARVRFDSTELADRRFGSIQRGILRNVSVGFNIHKNSETREPDTAKKIVRELTATDWEPLEVSQVPIGADSGASVRQAREFSRLYHNSTEDHNVDETTKAPIVEKDDGSINRALAEGARLEALRQDGIRLTAKTLRFNADDKTVNDLLVDSSIGLDEARSALISAAAERDEANATSSARADISIGVEETEKRGAAIVRGLMHRAFPAENKIERGTIESEFANRSLLWIAEDVLKRSGVNTSHMTRSQIAERALSMRSHAPASVRAPGMISTSDFPLILADVANKSLRLGYETAPRTFTAWARRTTAVDFKEIKRLQMSGGMALVSVPEGGEYTHASTNESQEKYHLETFGRMIAITRQTIVNDDLDAFSRVGQIYGAAAADLESDTVYGILGNNPAMSDGVALFHSSHANLAGGAGAPSVTTLGAARQAMRRQTDLDGSRILNIMPSFLIAPAALETTVDQLMAQTTPSTASEVVPGYVRALTPIIEPRLDDFSATAWFMASAPGRVDTVEYCYLGGEEGVQISSRQGWEVDGIEIKARLDFAAKAIDHRGMFKNAG